MADEFYGKGITVASGFDLSAKAPLDTRNVVNTIEERDAHVRGNRAYEGMKVYVLADKKEYRYSGTDWEVVGGLTDEQLNQLRAELNTKANLSDIPTKTSELVNDSTYVTESGVLEIIENSGGVGGATEISQGETEPTKESVLLWIDTTSDENMVENNLSNSLITEFQDSISTLNTRISTLEKNIEPPFGEDAHTHSNKVVLDKITQSYFDKWNNKSDFNGSYNSLTDKPTIPTRTSELTNDTNYVTSSSIPTSLPANGGNADTVGGYTIWTGTQSEYDAISSKNSTTIYFIKG